MRSTRWARWATCALAISITVPALAKSTVNKSISDCTSFQQSEKRDDALELALHNSCSMPVDCKVTWRVTCAPDSPKRRTAHAKTSKFTLASGTGTATEASAAECGDDSFSIDQVQWGCEPNKD
jgi:hypothetical protein